VEKISSLPNLIYAAVLILAALGVAVLPLLSPLGTIKTSDLELMRKQSIEIPLSAF
jgi:hypothetical protein